jgi:hypothetical protein
MGGIQAPLIRSSDERRERRGEERPQSGGQGGNSGGRAAPPRSRPRQRPHVAPLSLSTLRPRFPARPPLGLLSSNTHTHTHTRAAESEGDGAEAQQTSQKCALAHFWLGGGCGGGELSEGPSPTTWPTDLVPLRHGLLTLFPLCSATRRMSVSVCVALLGARGTGSEGHVVGEGARGQGEGERARGTEGGRTGRGLA